MSTCPRCGEKNRDTQRFCTNCGAELRPAPPSSPAKGSAGPVAEPRGNDLRIGEAQKGTVAANSMARPRKNGCLPKVLGALLALVALAIGAAVLFGRSNTTDEPEPTAEAPAEEAPLEYAWTGVSDAGNTVYFASYEDHDLSPHALLVVCDESGRLVADYVGRWIDSSRYAEVIDASGSSADYVTNTSGSSADYVTNTSNMTFIPFRPQEGDIDDASMTWLMDSGETVTLEHCKFDELLANVKAAGVDVEARRAVAERTQLDDWGPDTQAYMGTDENGSAYLAWSPALAQGLFIEHGADGRAVEYTGSCYQGTRDGAEGLLVTSLDANKYFYTDIPPAEDGTIPVHWLFDQDSAETSIALSPCTIDDLLAGLNGFDDTWQGTTTAGDTMYEIFLRDWWNTDAQQEWAELWIFDTSAQNLTAGLLGPLAVVDNGDGTRTFTITDNEYQNTYSLVGHGTDESGSLLFDLGDPYGVVSLQACTFDEFDAAVNERIDISNSNTDASNADDTNAESTKDAPAEDDATNQA